MAGGIMTTGGFANLYDARFRKIFFDAYARVPELWSKVAKVETINSGHSILEGNMSSLGALQETAEGGATPIESFKQGNSKEVFYQNFSLGVQITENMKDDDLTGNMNKAFQELGKAAAYTRELQFWDVLNGAFGTTRVALDGKALCASDHSYIDASGTQSNLTTGALSQSTLQDALNKFRKLKNEKGIPIVANPDLLIIPPDLIWMVRRLMLSEYNPGATDASDNMTANVLKPEGLKYIVVPYLTSTTAWFLIDSSMHDLRFIWRKKLQFKSYDDPNTDNAIFKAKMRITTNFWEWRGVVGSTGA